MSTMTLDSMFGSAPAIRRSSTMRSSTQRPSTQRPSTMRLTRRGRVVVFVGALLVAFVIGVFVTAAGSVATQEPGAPEATEIVQVGTGDTLWGIASELADDGEVREMMSRIERLNALETTVLQAGQRLVVPAG